MNTNSIKLGKADAGTLQDAWHYAMLILRRGDSTFDGDREFRDGIRGQILAYERLLEKIYRMTADHETDGLLDAGWNAWLYPQTFDDLVKYTRLMQDAINCAATRLHIDARSGEKVS